MRARLDQDDAERVEVEVGHPRSSAHLELATADCGYSAKYNWSKQYKTP